jgi:hypothetical protein
MAGETIFRISSPPPLLIEPTARNNRILSRLAK